jgi:large subunit ribosomal protein L18
MAHGPIYRVAFRRRREGRTDYRTRLALLKSRSTRVVVRRTSNNTIVQFVDFDAKGDLVRAQATAMDLVALGWDKSRTATPAAYLTGLLAAQRAKAAGIESGVLDIGRMPPTAGGRVFAALKGVVDGGIEVPHGDDVLPSEDRLTGAHLGDEIPALVEAVKGKLSKAVKPSGN